MSMLARGDMAEDGSYGSNNRFWQVDLDSSGCPSCPLSELRNCRVCVGGGFEIAPLDNRRYNSYEGFIQHMRLRSAEDPPSTAVSETLVEFCFAPDSQLLEANVKGWGAQDWPSEEIFPLEMTSYLVDTVAPRFPHATIEFESLSLLRS